LRPFVAYCVALAAVAAAVFVRWMIDPWLGVHLPLVTLFAAVAVAVWFGGYRPALLAMTLGYLVCDYLFIEPRDHIGFVHNRDLIGLAAYLLTCSIIIGFGEAMRLARRRAESAAREAAEQQDKWRTTLCSIGDAVVVTDTGGKVTYLNPVAESLTGWTNKEAVGQPLPAVFCIVNESTKLPLDDPVAKVLALGGIVGLANHTVLIARNGAERPIDDSASPIRDDRGKVLGVVLIFRDVGARRKSEVEHQQLAAIVESSNDAIVAKDLNGIVTSWNKAASELYGYSAEEIVGRPISILAASESANEMPQILERLQRGERVEHYETMRRRKDGKEIAVSLTISPIRDAAGRIVGASKIARDVTEQRRLQKALEQRTEQLADADRLKNEFLAMLSHEMRNLLAPIINALNVIKMHKETQSETFRRPWAIIDRQSRALRRLVDDLLDVNRIARGTLNLQKGPVEIADIVSRAVEIGRPLIKARQQQFDVRVPDEPVLVDADCDRMVQVVSNLLNNASKYTSEYGHIWLMVEPAEGEVAIRVRDNGIGLAADMLPKVFDLFTHSERPLERSEGGLGIGLTLVRRLTEMHQGSVAAFSEGPGRGSEFVVTLPLLRDGIATAPPKQGEPDDRRVPDAKRRILVVDDNHDGADSLAMMLRLSGHEVHAVYDGRLALAMVGSYRPDVVLLDIGLPDMDGYAVAQQLRSAGFATTALVALTGYGMEEDRRQTQSAGFNAHLVKPVDLDALRELLAELPTS
jgi:PAS domain S-box-containing protein